ncbi:MAG TPA: VOC family protein [Candidatus Binatia bacterium]|jgi:catechol-2,3-dioxygenase
MEPKTSTAGTVQHLDHFVLPVMQPERAEKFYVEVLGGRVLRKMNDASVNRTFIKVGQNHIGLFSQNKAALPKPETLDSFPRYSFEVSAGDFQKITLKLHVADGLARKIEKRGIATGCGAHEGIACADSEGNLLELFRGEDAPTRLHHLHFDTLDLKESIRFYTEILKLTLLERDKGLAVIGVPSRQSIVLHEVAALSPVTTTTYRGRHFAFHVRDDDFHAIVERLHRAGIDERDDHGEREGRRPGQLGTYFKEPSGFRLQITNEDSATFAAHAA